MPSLGRTWIRSGSIKSVVFAKNNKYTAYNGKNNNKNNKHYNHEKEEKRDLCLRLRILFVSFFEPDSKMCAIPFKGFDRKIHIKREAVTVSLFVLYSI